MGNRPDVCLSHVVGIFMNDPTKLPKQLWIIDKRMVDDFVALSPLLETEAAIPSKYPGATHVEPDSLGIEAARESIRRLDAVDARVCFIFDGEESEHAEMMHLLGYAKARHLDAKVFQRPKAPKSQWVDDPHEEWCPFDRADDFAEQIERTLSVEPAREYAHGKSAQQDVRKLVCLRTR